LRNKHIHNKIEHHLFSDVYIIIGTL
jgi:hypothetical protein